MKTKYLFLLAIMFVGLSGSALAQFSIRPSARLLYATRGGFFFGLNQSFHSGDIPTNPNFSSIPFQFSGITSTPNFVNDKTSSNFIFGGHIDKAVSSNVTLGLRVIFDQMNLEVGQSEKQPFRIADNNGALYDVSIDNNMDYTLRYLTFAGVIKVYFYRTYGFYFLAGASVGTLLTGDFSHNPVVIQPTWAQGSQGAGVSDEIPEVNSFRFSLIPGIGYDFYYRGVFITPEFAGDIALTDVLEDGYTSGDPWRVINLQATLRISFIIL
jgi:outer membrane protein with beta-barrel domain